MQHLSINRKRGFTSDEIEFILSKIGMYTINSVAKRLGRTYDSVAGALRKHKVISSVQRFENGITPTVLCREWQVSHVNINYWIKKFNLPIIEPSKVQRTNMGKEKPVVIIDDMQIHDWWRSGYGLILEINPIDKENTRILNEIRQELYKKWIPSVAISEALFITQNHIAELITAGKIVEPVFLYRNRAYLDRTVVYNWIKTNHGAKQAWYIANYEWNAIE
jgi:hypothetical protein